MSKYICRFCGEELHETFIDLGLSPLSNDYIPIEEADKGQMTYPLIVRVCDKCFLVQADAFETPDGIFSEYAYFSSFSTSWLMHAKEYADYMTSHYPIDENSQVIEIASNDGYLLQYLKGKNIPVLGIEPAKNVAETARKEKGIPTITEFFGTELAKKLRADGRCADLLIGNNVLAHVPNINDFVEGLKILLSDDGIITMEFPHLLRLMEENQFDTIYHEHFSYLSLGTVKAIFQKHGLRLFDVQEWPTHGGSLRIFACHENCGRFNDSGEGNVEGLLAREKVAGLADIATYRKFSESAVKIKCDLLSCIITLKREGKTIAAYGAAAKGNTLLNYCGIRREFVAFASDKSPHKQGTLLPGSRIPIYPPEKISEAKPEYVLILPWNLKSEIMEELSYIRDWGAKFILPIPRVEIV